MATILGTLEQYNTTNQKQTNKKYIVINYIICDSFVMVICTNHHHPMHTVLYI